MLRLNAVIRGDIRFQWKYGIYFIYVIVVVLYIGILSLLKGDVKEVVCQIMVYSDPAAMGMFFMGAIVLLEKSQRVLNSIAVSPVTPAEYIGGKLCSIGAVSLLVGGILMVQTGSKSPILAVIGLILASFLFTLCGIFVGTKIGSLTGYIIGTVPFEIIGFAPPIIYRIGWIGDSVWFLLHPGCAAMYLIKGETSYVLWAILSCVVWNVVLFLIAKKCVTKMFRSVGGVKL